jgi:hypothetical protein
MAKKRSKNKPQLKTSKNNVHTINSKKFEWVKLWLPLLLGVWGTVLSTYLAVDAIFDSKPKIYVQSSVVVDGISNDGKAVGHVDAYLTNIGEANVALEIQAEALASNLHDINGPIIVFPLLCAQMETDQSNTSNSLLGKPPVLKPGETAVCKSDVNINLEDMATPGLSGFGIRFQVFDGKSYLAFITIPQFISSPIDGTEGRSWMGGAVAVSE